MTPASQRSRSPSGRSGAELMKELSAGRRRGLQGPTPGSGHGTRSYNTILYRTTTEIYLCQDEYPKANIILAMARNHSAVPLLCSQQQPLFFPPPSAASGGESKISPHSGC